MPSKSNRFGLLRPERPRPPWTTGSSSTAASIRNCCGSILRLEANGKEHLQGDIVCAAGSFQMEVRVFGTAPIRQIDITKNQEFPYTRQNLPQDVAFTYEDAGKQAGEDFYYVRVQQNDGNVAWSSPIWVTTN